MSRRCWPRSRRRDGDARRRRRPGAARAVARGQDRADPALRRGIPLPARSRPAARPIRPTARRARNGPRSSRRATCRGAAPRARRRDGSRSSTRWPISSSMPSILPGISSRASARARCRATSMPIGSGWRRRRRSTTRCSPRGSPMLGARYGDLPAHDGLWEAAQATPVDLLARLAVVPLVLEARGLDVTPGMIARLVRFGDAASAAVLQVIHRRRDRPCRGRRALVRLGLRPARPRAWPHLSGAGAAPLQGHAQAALQPCRARDAAGFVPHFYEALAGDGA